MKTLPLFFVGVGLIALALFAYPIVIARDHESMQPNEISMQKDALDIWIDRLADFECANCPDNFRRIDSNGHYSYSCLQFQADTFQAEVRRHRLLPFTEDEELMNWIYDCPFQKSLARLMIQASGPPAARRHWYTSVVIRGLGDPPIVNQ